MKIIEIKDKAARVKLNEYVYKDSMDQLIKEIEEAYGMEAVHQNLQVGEIVAVEAKAVDTLTIEINSPGGSVFEGWRAYNALKKLQARGVEVTAIIDGVAASMGSVIAMGANRVLMAKGSRMMIHNALMGTYGNAADHLKSATMLESVSNEIAGAYNEKTGMKLSEIKKLMDSETWMDTKDAISKGFADGVAHGSTENFSESLDKPDNQNEKPLMTSIVSRIFGSADAAKIAELEASIAENDTLRKDLEASQAKVTELQGLAEVIATQSAEITAHVADIKAKSDKIAELEKSVSAVTASIPQKIAEAFAAAGQPPLPLHASQEPTETTITKAEFDKLTPKGKSDFCLKGGKIK